MSVHYKCARCVNFESSSFRDIKKHIFRKIPCKKNNKTLFWSDDQIIVLSMLPNLEDASYNIQHLDNSNIITDNSTELLQEIENIEKNKIKCCKYCNESFNLIIDLKKHVILTCFFDMLNKRKALLNSNTTINCNNYNQCTINNNNNIINIKLEIKSPVPFDDDWNTSHISNTHKERLTTSKYMYSKLLEEILKNEINLNVIIDSKKDSGMVYKNDIDKYIQMKSKDIVEKTMQKLNSHLIQFNKDDKESLDESVTHSIRMINKKHIDFQKSNEIQNNVGNLICSIYENKRNDAIDVAKHMMNDDKINENGTKIPSVEY